MPSAGIPLRPSFVRSIHARIARPRPFTRVQQRRSGRRTPMKLLRRQFLHLAAGAAAVPVLPCASPDGYTIQVGQMGTHAAAVAFYPNLAYKPDVDFEPIGMIAGLPIVITARKDFPANDLKEFIRYVKANAGKVNAAHAGVGSITHTTCLLLHSLLGVQPTFVPFNGAA